MRTRLLSTLPRWTAIVWTAIAWVGIAHADWPTYGGDAGSQKYSPLAQIDADNAHQLQPAWQWQSPDNQLVTAQPNLTPWGFKSTPIHIDGVLYVSTSLGHVAAIDAASGQSLWTFDTKTYADGRPTNLGFNHRGGNLYMTYHQQLEKLAQLSRSGALDTLGITASDLS